MNPDDTTRRRTELAELWERVNRQLDDLTAGRIDPEANPDPAVREVELLTMLDRIEWELGQLDRLPPNT